MRFPGGSFSNLTWNLGQLRSARMSWLWFGLVIGIQALVECMGGVDSLKGWYLNLGLSRAGILAGNIWQIFSYGFLHGAWWHAALNALFVLLIGSRIEHMAGRAVMMRVTLAGILGGAVCHLWMGSGLLVGLSGGGMALLLMLTTLSPQSRMFPLPVSGKSLGLGILLAALLLALMDPALDVPGFSVAGKWLLIPGMGSWFDLGHACHFGGGLAGWLYGRWLLRPRVTLARLRRERARRERVE